MEEQFPVPRNHASSKIGNGVISLLWQLRWHCNPDHNKISSSSNTTVVSVFPNLCLWRRSLRSNVGGIDPEKLYRATLKGALCYKHVLSSFIYPKFGKIVMAIFFLIQSYESSKRWRLLFSSLSRTTCAAIRIAEDQVTRMVVKEWRP